MIFTKMSTKTRNSKNSPEEFDPTTSCGIGSWRPKWLQVFANPISFMVAISFVSIVQAMAWSQLFSTMSTMEKRYAFNSKVSSVIFLGDSIMCMVLGPIVGYYGVRFNRSRLIGFGQIMIAFACFISVLPYLIYGSSTKYPQEFSTTTISSSNSTLQMCTRDQRDFCSADTKSTVWFAVVLLFLGNLFRGVGFSIHYVIAMPFIDDNVSKGKSPLYISLMHSILLIGPTFGFLLSGYGLSLSEDPWNDPGIPASDPRFIGAWWFGFVISGILNFLSALPLFIFPAGFKGATVKAVEIKKKMAESGTVNALKRFTKNPLVILYFFGNILRYFGIGGFYMLLAKYIESQYRQTSSASSYIMGNASILPISAGMLIGGIYITWVRPNTRLLFTLIFLAEFSTFFTFGSGIFLGCNQINLNGEFQTNESFSLQSSCNLDCDCSTHAYTPICGPDLSTTYFSPCHAGCTDYNATDLTFSNCSCFSGSATKGYCAADKNCPNLPSYIVMIVLGAFISATAKTGNSLITLRTVEPHDKSFTNGLLNSLSQMFSFIPGPLIFGYITDSVCLVWEQNACGNRGNCWIYDQEKFKNTFIGVSVIFMALGSVFDFIMIFYSDRIKDMYGESDRTESEDNRNQNHKDNFQEIQNNLLKN